MSTVDPKPARLGSGWFGEFGGQFVPETLIPALEELTDAWTAAREDECSSSSVDHIVVGVRRMVDAVPASSRRSPFQP